MIAGAIVAERYRLDRKLGEGGMGAVWAATHIVTRKRVAIKVLKPELAKNAGLVERFLREARAACAVQHPNVVQIHDVLQMTEGVPLMVMDLLHGESLAERLVSGGRLSVPDLSRIMLKVLPAVVAAHAAHVVHRDLKPDNLFLCHTEDGSVDLKVLDFGIAKVSSTDAEAGVLTKTGSMLGTPFYMAPEQLFGEKDVDFRADIWSLGIIVYECLSGRRPTEADNLGQIIKLVTSTGIQPLESHVPHVPPDICHIVQRMLTSDRRARLADLGEARVVFERYAAASNVLSSPPTGPARTQIASGSDAPPARTGPTQWAATPPQPAVAPRAKSPAWRSVAAVAAGLSVAVTLVIVVPRLRARSAAPAASASNPAQSGGVPAGLSAQAQFDGSVAPPSAAAPAIDTVDASPIVSGTGAPAHRPLDPRPIVRGAPSLSSHPQPTPPTRPAPTQGVLVEKPPF